VVVDFQEKLMPHIFERERILKRAELLIFAAGKLGIPVLATEQYPKGLGKTVTDISSVWPGCVPIEKTDFSCAGSGEFMEKLAALGRRQVVITGVEAHVCVSQTALELAARSFSVFVIADATGSRKALDARLALRRLEACGVTVVGAEAAVFEWLRKSGTAEFREVQQKIKENG